MNRNGTKTERQIFQRNLRDNREKCDKVLNEMVEELRIDHKAFAGKNYEIEYDEKLNWGDFLKTIDSRYKRRISKIGNNNYKNTKSYKKWTHLMNMFKNVVKHKSNRKYKNTLSIMNNM